MKKIFALILMAVMAFSLAACGNDDQVVNIYTTRHYDTDDALFERFTEETGIEVNIVNDKAPALIEKIKAEGDLPQADLFFTADAGYLALAKQEGILQAIASDTLEANVPAKYRDIDDMWFGLTKRARVFLYDNAVDPTGLTYENATTMFPGELLIRSSSNIYNQSLVASFIELKGESATTAWVQDIVMNMARTPEGNDRGQAVAITNGYGTIAIANSYYYGLLVNETDTTSEYYGVADQVGIYFPNQGDGEGGVHINVSGAGVIKNASNAENAIRLIEFLSESSAQEEFSANNYEFPVNPNAEISDLLQSWLDNQGITVLREQDINLTALGEHNELAIIIMTNASWDNPDQ
ncbi:extracellular solute-binding protein [Candidatus Xianfuyuplasma coldseepsis]|uniref:Extracellular solute-binding protein n=1 Tax=Candidatus Xianfuyuplasma coldseepsis TaxID=2782163 RepID=A0A7L7KUD4_9MOLU|nr:extracellular solute-binding protein [Xianfuyuplasma coldseepsis]QMS85378.1 extracellular solute-binding protein [Xianfuyuplasma coldseepsis]